MLKITQSNYMKEKSIINKKLSLKKVYTINQS